MSLVAKMTSALRTWRNASRNPKWSSSTEKGLPSPRSRLLPRNVASGNQTQATHQTLNSSSTVSKRSIPQRLVGIHASLPCYPYQDKQMLAQFWSLTWDWCVLRLLKSEGTKRLCLSCCIVMSCWSHLVGLFQWFPPLYHQNNSEGKSWQKLLLLQVS